MELQIDISQEGSEPKNDFVFLLMKTPEKELIRKLARQNEKSLSQFCCDIIFKEIEKWN